VGLDDVYDALAVLETARHIVEETARRTPEEPPRDSEGLPMQVLF